MSLSAHWSRFLRTSPTMARIQESWLLAHRGSCRLPGCGIIEDAEFIEVYYSDTGRISADQSESRSSRKLSARAGRVDVLPGCAPWVGSRATSGVNDAMGQIGQKRTAVGTEVQATTIKSALNSLPPVSAQHHAHYRGYATIPRDRPDRRYALAAASRLTVRP